MLTMLGRSQEHLRVLRCRRIDEHGVDVIAAQHSSEVALMRHAKARSCGLSAGLVVVPDTLDGRLGMCLHLLGITVGMDMGETEHSNTKHGTSFHNSLRMGNGYGDGEPFVLVA